MASADLRSQYGGSMSEDGEHSWQKKLIVAAIDFGTTQSGFAVSFLDRYMNNKTDMLTHLWKSGGYPDTFKTPTCLLLNPDKSFNSFGYEAENAYADLAESETHTEYWYFRRFKMQLFHEKRESSLYHGDTIKDSQGRDFPALDVFALSINYLREQILKTVREKVPAIKPDDIYYVLTAPAIWSEYSKRFMRMAAQKAGIDSNHLRIALEPECAAVYVKSKQQTTLGGAGHMQPGVQFMVADLGGGTLDITVYKINAVGQCEEIHVPDGGPWGGDNVNNQFEEYIKSVVGAPAFKAFHDDHMEDFLEFRRMFENKKRSFDDSNPNSITSMKLPLALLEVHKEHNREEMVQSVKRHSANVSMKLDKFRIDTEIFFKFFRDTINNITRKIREVLSSVPKLDMLICVGGFSDCNVLKKALREKFSDTTLIIPEEAVAAIMKGAIIYGRDQSIIDKRLCRHTYGLDWNEDFNPHKHPAEKKEVNEGYVCCKDIFLKLIEKGQPVSRSTPAKEISAFPKSKYQTEMEFPFYRSDILESPQFIDDSGCHRVGSLTVSLPVASNPDDNEVKLRVYFGATELRAEAIDKDGHRYNVRFRLVDTQSPE